MTIFRPTDKDPLPSPIHFIDSVLHNFKFINNCYSGKEKILVPLKSLANLHLT